MISTLVHLLIVHLLNTVHLLVAPLLVVPLLIVLLLVVHVFIAGLHLLDGLPVGSSGAVLQPLNGSVVCSENCAKHRLAVGFSGMYPSDMALQPKSAAVEPSPSCWGRLRDSDRSRTRDTSVVPCTDA